MTALPRLAAAALAHAASVMPVTIVTGARQTGKSTLVRDLAPAGPRPFFTLDGLDVLEQASAAPDDLRDPATDPSGVADARRPRDLSDALAHDAARATGHGTRRHLAGTARYEGPR